MNLQASFARMFQARAADFNILSVNKRTLKVFLNIKNVQGMLELENFLKKFTTHEEELCIVILNKKLFRIGHGDPESQLDKRAYYCLIGHAY
jgi:hypothetical protein